MGLTKILLDAGAEVNPRDETGATPLDVALFWFSKEDPVIALLELHGAERGKTTKGKGKSGGKNRRRSGAGGGKPRKAHANASST